MKKKKKGPEHEFDMRSQHCSRCGLARVDATAWCVTDKEAEARVRAWDAWDRVMSRPNPNSVR